MTDNEVIKALECCSKSSWINDCDGCPCYDEKEDIQTSECQERIMKNSLDLINRQQEEKEMLQAENKMLQDNLDICYKQNMLLNPGIKANAIEEFVARFLKIVHDNHYLLVDRINSKDYGMFTIGIEQAVDETKKEMVGDAE